MTVTDASRDEWIKNRMPASGFLREGSIRIYRSVEGTGIAPGIDAYPHQYLDIGFNEETMPVWSALARFAAWNARIESRAIIPNHRAGNLKHPGFTPLGTSVATLAREGHDMLASDCGYCSSNLANCKCGSKGAE